MQYKQVIHLEGSIGNGKSTTLDQIKRFNVEGLKLHFIPEPIHLWDTYKKDGKTILELFYEDR